MNIKERLLRDYSNNTRDAAIQRIEHLEKALDDSIQSIIQSIKKLESTLAAKDAEIERLREALQKIVDWPDYRSPSHQEIARDALKEKE